VWAAPVSNMNRWALPLALVAALVVAPLLATPARAADVSVTLIAKDIAWHVGSDTGTSTTITVNVGDTLRLRVENHETTTTTHTFTVPQFAINQTLNQGDVFFWNHTAVAADVQSWQFFCYPHSSGTYPARIGMVGILRFATPTPPPTPGFEAVLAIAALAGVALAVRVTSRRKK